MHEDRKKIVENGGCILEKSFSILYLHPPTNPASLNYTDTTTHTHTFCGAKTDMEKREREAGPTILDPQIRDLGAMDQH